MSLRRSAAVLLANCHRCGAALGETALRAVSSSLQHRLPGQHHCFASEVLRRDPPAADCPALDISQAYLSEVHELQSQIFGTHFGNGLRSGRKVLRKAMIGDKVASYYPASVSKSDPLYVDDRVERQRAKLDKLKRRGKGPPKKGQGKRAGKRKSKG